MNKIVLLEHPRVASAAHFNDIANTPLWSCLMTGYAGAGLLRAGFEVEIVDASGWTFEQTVHHLANNPTPGLLAVHAVYFWEETAALFRMLSDLRGCRFDAPICLFGFFPGLMWKEILDHSPAVDYVIVGEPEETITELAGCIETGDRSEVKGVALRIQGKASFQRMRPPIESPDKLAFPLRPFLESEETVSVLASRGCYNQCSFCLVPTLDGQAAWRGRSAENVTAEVSQLVSLGKRDFYFVDPNFAGPGKEGKQAVVKLARQLRELAITFGIETRANDITPGLMRELVDSGLTRLLLGIESGRPDVLKRLGKRTNVACNEKAIATVREFGLEPEIGFIMFDAASTLDGIHQNLGFLQRNRLLDRLGRTANLLYHDHVAFKGTPGYRSALEQNILLPRGLFGFEGLLLYEDFRVGWLAGIMKKICHSVLREMGKPFSPVHWSGETAQGVYRAVNDLLVNAFERLLSLAEGLSCPPDENWTEEFFLKEWLGIRGEWAEVEGQGAESFPALPAEAIVHVPPRCLETSKTLSPIPPLPLGQGRGEGALCELTSQKKRFPFRLATTSYILPADILPNIQFLGRYFDEIELVLFESGNEGNLPTLDRIREMGHIASELDFTYNVHLPVDLYLGDHDPALRREFCSRILSFYERTLALAPTAYILHLDSRRSDKTIEPDNSAWTDRVFESLETLKMKGFELQRIAVENLEYPVQLIAPIVNAFDMAFCLDIGHLMRYGYDLAGEMESFLKLASMVHLHGVDDGKDHLGLDRIPPEQWGYICSALREYRGGLSVEVFSLDDLARSLNRMQEIARREEQQ